MANVIKTLQCYNAVTTKEISGSAIDTMPIGTKFIVYGVELSEFYAYSNAIGLSVNLIYNNEYTLLDSIVGMFK